MDIEYKLVRTNRKSVGIKIAKDGEVVVRSPHSVPKAEIDRIVEGHRTWIIEKQSLVRDTQAKLQITELEERELSVVAFSTLSLMTAKLAVKYGMPPVKITITSAKSRFGSCSSKGRISYSKYLMLYPREAIEYVVVHELCHLRYMNHSREFYALVEKCLPDWKERRKKLAPEYMRQAAEVLYECQI